MLLADRDSRRALFTASHSNPALLFIKRSSGSTELRQNEPLDSIST
jgi:hypothetical protein